MLSTEDQKYQHKYIYKKKTYLYDRNFHRYNYFTEDDDEFIKYFKNFANKSTKKNLKLLILTSKWSFYLQKLFFKINDSSVSAIKGVGNLIATIDPEVNASVEHIIFTLTKANTKTYFSTRQIV